MAAIFVGRCRGHVTPDVILALRTIAFHLLSLMQAIYILCELSIHFALFSVVPTSCKPAPPALVMIYKQTLDFAAAENRL